MLTNWLGKWFGGWFGASAPSSPGAMSGAATVGIAASAGLTASGVMSGAAALSISSSGSIGVSLPGNNACWGASWGGTWGVSWGFLEVPYQELSLKGQVFVRSYLASVYSADVAERVISAAKVNGLSVRDAEVAVAAKVGETVLHAVKTRSVGAVEKPRRVKLANTKQPSGLAAKYFQQSVIVEQCGKSVLRESTEIQLVVCRNASRADVVNYYL